MFYRIEYVLSDFKTVHPSCIHALPYKMSTHCSLLQCVAVRCSVLQCTTCIHNAPIHIHNAPIHMHYAPVHMHYAHTHMHTRWAYEPFLHASAKHIVCDIWLHVCDIWLHTTMSRLPKIQRLICNESSHLQRVLPV